MRLTKQSGDLDAENIEDIDNMFQQAVAKGDVDVVNQLIAKGANVNGGITVGIGRTSPLLNLAIQEGHIAVAELLIANGANVNAKAKKGVRPLQLAAEGGHEDLVGLLKRHSARE